jgi:hypothetical protein
MLVHSSSKCQNCTLYLTNLNTQLQKKIGGASLLAAELLTLQNLKPVYLTTCYCGRHMLEPSPIELLGVSRRVYRYKIDLLLVIPILLLLVNLVEFFRDQTQYSIQPKSLNVFYLATLPSQALEA